MGRLPRHQSPLAILGGRGSVRASGASFRRVAWTESPMPQDPGCRRRFEAKTESQCTPTEAPPAEAVFLTTEANTVEVTVAESAADRPAATPSQQEDAHDRAYIERVRAALPLERPIHDIPLRGPGGESRAGAVRAPPDANLWGCGGRNSPSPLFDNSVSVLVGPRARSAHFAPRGSGPGPFVRGR
jgi:hypothetical protein